MGSALAPGSTLSRGTTLISSLFMCSLSSNFSSSGGFYRKESLRTPRFKSNRPFYTCTIHYNILMYQYLFKSFKMNNLFLVHHLLTVCFNFSAKFFADFDLSFDLNSSTGSNSDLCEF